MADQAKKSTFFGGVATLATGVVIVKLIGALYKIPLANILGEEGNSYFTTAYNIYNVFLTISTAGLPVALSKAVSEANALGRYNQVDRVFKVALGTFLALGTLSTLIMFFGAELITAVIGSTGASASVRALAFSALFVCCMAAFRGYFQGHGNMAPTSKSQIVEAAIKLLLGLALAALLAGAAVSFAGLLGFVGLVIPNLMRSLIGEESRPLLAASALGGAGGLTLCDLLGRLIFAPYELPVGIVLSLLGGPFFICLLLRQRGGRIHD